MKKTIAALSLFALLGIAYFSGPTPTMNKPVNILPQVPHDLSALEQYISNKEKSLPVKSGCEAKIVWNNDSAKTKTPIALVYLHGFSSSHEEGNPAHMELAKALGANLYLSRLDQHGLNDDEPLLNMTADGLIQTAKEAYAIGQQLGDEVILIGTSTGGTLALQLAAMFPEIKALVLYSPNIEIADPSAHLLNKPWGLQIARQVFGSNYREKAAEPPISIYWNTKYRLESLIELEELLAETMTEETFNNVKQPVFLGYYYKDEENQDEVVSVPAMLEMFDELGTEAELKRKHAFPKTGDHVIASKHKSKNYPEVINQTLLFCEEILQLQTH